MAGYILIHRKLLNWGWYSVPCVKDVFLHLLLTANYAESEYHGKVIDRGQAIFGLDSMAKNLGYSKQQIRTAIEKLKKTKEITVWSNHHYSIATILNYELYQFRTEQHTDNTPTTHQQHTDNTQITHNQHTDNTIKINNKINNYNNSGSIISTSNTKPTREELIEIWGAENVQ